MKTVEVEICALTNNDSFTLGRGRNYSAAIEDARRRARFPHSICAIVLTWKSPLIRAYSRPQHRFGIIVPCEAIDPRCARPAPDSCPAAAADIGAAVPASA